jgi:lactoylglutathione lyase
MRRCALSAVVLSAVLAAQPQTPSRPKITGVAHIAFYAADFEKTRAFYRDFLGFAEPYTLTNPDGSPSVAFFKVNERQYIELFPEREAGTDRLHHISIETDDAEAMRRYLASRGIKVPERVNKVRIGNSAFNITDPDGHTVEIVQYEPSSWTARERGRHLPESRISTRMMHIGIIVGSLEEAMKFYRDVLGFRETWRGSRSTTVLDWVNMQVPEGDDYIEFMLYKDKPEPTRRGSAHHICLETSDIAASLARLEARPYRQQYTRPLEIRTGTNRKRQLNIFDPDGTRTELMEPHTIDGKPTPSSTAPPPR